MAKKKKTKKYKASTASQSFHVESKAVRNKKLALLLLTSMIVFLSIYFGFLKAKLPIIQEVYIWSSFVLAIGYVFVAFAIAFLKQKNENENEKKNGKLLSKLDRIRRMLIIIFLPMIVALLVDIMLINLGLADNFGI